MIINPNLENHRHITSLELLTPSACHNIVFDVTADVSFGDTSQTGLVKRSETPGGMHEHR